MIVMMIQVSFPSAALAGGNAGEEVPYHCEGHEHCGATVVNVTDLTEVTQVIEAPAFDTKWFVYGGANQTYYGEDGTASGNDTGWQLGVGYNFKQDLDVRMMWEDFGGIDDNTEAQALTLGLGYTKHPFAKGKMRNWVVGGSLGYSLVFAQYEEIADGDIGCSASTSSRSRSRAWSEADALSDSEIIVTVEKPDYASQRNGRPQPLPKVTLDVVTETVVDVDTYVATDTVSSTSVSCVQNVVSQEDEVMRGAARLGLHTGWEFDQGLTVMLEAAHREASQIDQGLTSVALNVGWRF